MQKIVANGVSRENYRVVVAGYIEQLKLENDILEFKGVFGYYMLGSFVHELRLDGEQLVDITYDSWSVEEKNFVMTKLSPIVW